MSQVKLEAYLRHSTIKLRAFRKALDDKDLSRDLVICQPTRRMLRLQLTNSCNLMLLLNMAIIKLTSFSWYFPQSELPKSSLRLVSAC